MPSKVKCPYCGGPAVADRDGYRCEECGGLWLDVADLNRILLHAGLQTLEAMGGRANPDEEAGECPTDMVDLLAVQSFHKRNPLTYETCESCGGIWLESADFAVRIDSREPFRSFRNTSRLIVRFPLFLNAINEIPASGVCE